MFRLSSRPTVQLSSWTDGLTV